MESSIKSAGHSAPTPASVAPLSPVALLRTLDGWFGAAGYAADHPWRASIADTLRAPTWSTLRESDSFDWLLESLREIRVLAEAASAWTERSAGCQMDRKECGALFGLIATRTERATGEVRESIDDFSLLAALDSRISAKAGVAQ